MSIQPIRKSIFYMVFAGAIAALLPMPAEARNPVFPARVITLDPASIRPSGIIEESPDRHPIRQSEIIDVGSGFDMVGAVWELSEHRRQRTDLDSHEESEARLEVRTASSVSDWGPWLSSEETDGPDPQSSEGESTKIAIGPIYVGPSRYLQLRWRSPSGVEDPPRIAAVDVRGRSVSTLQKAIAYLREILRPHPLNAEASSPQPSIISRTAWGADESLRRESPSYGSVKLAIVHHTVSTNNYSPGDSAAIVRGIYAFHVLTNGWNDIGYNFLIDRYGQIFEGRYGGIDQPVIGAHSWGSNSQSTGIAIIGDFSFASIPPAAFSSLVTLLDWKLDVHSVDPTSRVSIVRSDGVPLELRAVSGHRDAFPTSCPGDGVYRTLDEAARQAREAGGQKVFGTRWTPEQPQWRGSSFEPVRFLAYLKYQAAWRVTIVDSRGVPVLTRSGSGGSIDVLWNSKFPDGRPVLFGTFYAVVEVDGSMTKRVPVHFGTDPSFEQWFLTYNPNSAPADVTFTISGNDGVLGVKTFSVQPRARHTFFVNEFVIGKEISARVDSSLPVVVERAIYFDFQKTLDGGDAAFGTPRAATQWYFAEGYTGSGFTEYLTLYNPNDAQATARIEFFFNPTGTQSMDSLLPPKTRKTIHVNALVGPGKEVAAQVSSDLPIVAERPQYFEYLGRRGGDAVVGATAPSTEWNFSEGYTGRGFHTYLTLANPGSLDAVATIEFLGNQGLIKKLDNVAVKAKGRTTILVNDHVGVGKEVSTKVRTTQPIVAERPVYFGYGDIDGGHVALGARFPKTEYFFAEGYTAPGFDEYLTLLNPNPWRISIEATYSFPGGESLSKRYDVSANSRVTIPVHDEVRRAGEVSVALRSSFTFYAERPMYFSYKAAWKGGSNVQGGAEPSTRWYFAEGYTG